MTPFADLMWMEDELFFLQAPHHALRAACVGPQGVGEPEGQGQVPHHDGLHPQEEGEVRAACPRL